MHLLSPLLLCVTLFLQGVLAETSFSQPPPGGPANNFQDNPTYKLNQKIEVQWTSNLTTMDLVIWQQYPMATDTQFHYTYLLQNTRSTSLIYTITMDGFSTDVSEGQDPIFYFAVYASGQTVIDGTSHYFNVTLPAQTSTTSTTATATTTRSLGNPTSTAPAAETTTKGSESDDKSSGLSTGAVAGIAVGATIGGILLLAGIGFFAWKHFRKGDASGQYVPGQQHPPVEEYKPPGMGHPGWIHPPPGQVPVPEMQVPPVFEAPTDNHKQTTVYEAP